MHHVGTHYPQTEKTRKDVAEITPLAHRRLTEKVKRIPTTPRTEGLAFLCKGQSLRFNNTKETGQKQHSWTKPLLTKKNTKAYLTFAKKHLHAPQDIWENILWTEEKTL